MRKDEISVAIVDDDVRLLNMLTSIVTASNDLSVVFAANNALTALNHEDFGEVDIFIMDINMPGMNGIEATARIKAKRPDVKVVVLTVFDDDEMVFDAVMSGATGYLLKDVHGEDLITYLKDAMSGGAPMSPSIAFKTLQFVRGKLPVKKEHPPELSKREIEILELLVLGDTYKVAADKLFISPHTVRTHIEKIYEKLQVHSRAEAVSRALKDGLVD